MAPDAKHSSTHCCPTHEVWELPTPLIVANRSQQGDEVYGSYLLVLTGILIDSDLVIRTFQVVTICRVDMSELIADCDDITADVIITDPSTDSADVIFSLAFQPRLDEQTTVATCWFPLRDFGLQCPTSPLLPPRKVPLEDLIYTTCTDPIPQPAAARTPRLHEPSIVTHLFYAYVRKATNTEFNVVVLGRDLILYWV
ncbi:hypothetical protein F511_11252 [Dorcoceras hygrometricum]|uniref:Uncharacterized protein n=1 Tax=Dorcoceras hygrometricum TaxID=472368 RepID=A0A2Z7DCN7_9LAMI|nr:hypothetical protein F511_11252 [Dorcoceras hygrometricum]